MNDSHIKTLAQVRAFLEGTQTVTFSLPTKTERYAFIRRSLIRFRYHRLPGPDQGLLLSFMAHVWLLKYTAASCDLVKDKG